MKHFTAREYQHIMMDHMTKNLRCAVWAGMGLGKSAGVLGTLDSLSLIEDIYPALILAPLRVARSTWKNECKKWQEFSHIGVSPVVGDSSQRIAALRQSADIFCVNYENIPWLVKQLDGKWPFHTIVADESTKLKNTRIMQGGTRSGALRTHAFTSKRFIELTGTPSPNGLKDLWGQVYLLDGGCRLGRTFEAFKQRWFRKSWTSEYGIEPLPHAQTEIQDKLKDICLSLNAADYFDIKEPLIIPKYVDLPPTARALYKKMEKELFIRIENREVEAFNAASKTNKILQLASGAIYLDHEVDDDRHPKAKEWKVVHDEKLEALDEIIEEAAGMPVLVAYNFKSDLARLKKAFPKGRHISSEKDENDFKAGKIGLAFAHPASLGHGVDGFQDVTNICAFFSSDWNMENFLQFIERIGPVRQIQSGFNRNVFVYIIIARDTMDEDVLERHKSKKSVQDILLEAMKHRRNA
jgi:SNF2 family DNA or RNA helicase